MVRVYRSNSEAYCYWNGNNLWKREVRMTEPQDRSEDNVPQEQVQDNPNWGGDKKLPEADGQAYWDDVTDDNREDAEDRPS